MKLRRLLPLLFTMAGLPLIPARPMLAQQVGATAFTADQAAAVDDAVRANMEKQRAVGVAIGIIRSGQIVYLNGYGWADAEKQIPVGPKTLFRWASISKTLTAIAALQLVQEGKLDLDADVRTYVPEFPDKGVVITTRQLLCHQSGIPHYSNGQIVVTRQQYNVAHPFEDVVTALDLFKESPLLFEPGQQFSYSTYAYILLSAVVQRAGNAKFATQIQNRIARPLALPTLQPDYAWIKNENRAAGYTLKNGEVVSSTDTDVSWKLGGGGFMSDVEDMTRYAQALLGSKLLSPEAKAAAWQPQKTANGEVTGFGLGFQLGFDGGTLKVFHTGSQEKARCRMVIYPTTGSGVVVMTNSEYVEPGEISTAIFAALGGA